MGDPQDFMTALEGFMTTIEARFRDAEARHQNDMAAITIKLNELTAIRPIVTTPTTDHATSSQAPPLLRPPPPPAPAFPDAVIVPRYTRLEFPTYDGKCDPLSWLTKCEQFFANQHVPAADQIHIAAFHMLDSAVLWASRLLTDRPNLLWDDFKRCCNLRFGPPIRSNPLGELTTLRQLGSVDEYLEQFQLLLAHVPLPPDMQVNIFTAGLRDRLRLDVEFEGPPDLVTAMSLARLCDRRLQLAREAYPTTPDIVPQGRTEMLQRRAHGLCYNCDEQYTRGHKCNRLFYLHVEDSDDEGFG
ncbi:hypothetical protein KSP39_PZI004151 [Platanthera zijinensis]|uniref:Retrotransposon gag domain-containing protein n=1 Tax=Platanthera zijinensis TaxID=2320716 RepID=A0AAP0GCP3_9ASPA